MDLRRLDKLEQIDRQLLNIRAILNPEDSPYICDTIVSNINDENLADLVMEMMARMGYKKSVIFKIIKIIIKIQS
jgi:hypothetical protein